jgi:hypothetical protein
VKVAPSIRPLWSYDELSRLKSMGARGFSLILMARATGHTRAQVDLALWALVGRSIGQAADCLNMPVLCGQGAGGATSVSRMAGE